MMQVTLLVKSLPSGQVEASVLELPAYRVEAESKEQAIEHLKKALLKKVEDAEAVSVQLPIEVTTYNDNLWKKMFGLFRDNPYFEEVIEIIQAEREALGDEDLDPAYYMPKES